MSHPDYENIGRPSDKAVEEIGELIIELGNTLKAIGKAKRFGLDNWHPDYPETSNRDTLLSELKDVMQTCEGLFDSIVATQKDLHTITPWHEQSMSSKTLER